MPCYEFHLGGGPGLGRTLGYTAKFVGSQEPPGLLARAIVLFVNND